MHVAARVAAVAAANEILATQAAVGESPGTSADAVRDVELRGVSAPVGFATIPWA